MTKQAEDRSSSDLVIGHWSLVIPKVTDFGLAKQLDDGPGRRPRAGPFVGTPSYMAPEQAEGKNQADRARPRTSMLWVPSSTSASPAGRPSGPEDHLDTLTQVITEEPVPPTRLVPRCPRDLETICLKCLQKEPHRRYASARDLADDLYRFLNGEPIQARPASIGERAVKWSKRRPALAALVAVSLLAVTSLLGVGLVYNARLREALQDTEVARQDAEEKGEAARESLAHAEASLYLSQIATSFRDWQANDVARAEERLDSCPLARRHWEWHFLKQLCRGELFSFQEGSPEVFCLAFSPDGRRLATTGGNSFQQGLPGKVRLRDPLTGEVLLTFQGHGKGGITGMAFSPDGKRVASATRVLDFATLYRNPTQLQTPEGEVLIWDAESGKVLRKLKDCYRSVSFSRDGRLATAGLDRTVKIWGPNEKEPSIVLRSVFRVRRLR